jgi:hypothetical protein
LSNAFGWTPEQVGGLTPAQGMAYSRRGKRRKGAAVGSDADAIEITRRQNLRLLREARALMGGR